MKSSRKEIVLVRDNKVAERCIIENGVSIMPTYTAKMESIINMLNGTSKENPKLADSEYFFVEEI